VLRNVPVKHPKPDARGFIDVLMGRGRSAAPPLVEYLVDDVVMREIVTGLLGRTWADGAQLYRILVSHGLRLCAV
jgi:hypothetical protein